MSENQITPDDLAGRLRPAATGAYIAEMAVGILRTPSKVGGTLADKIRASTSSGTAD